MVTAIPKTNTNLAGFGFGAMLPSWLRRVPVPVLVPSLFRGANRERCVNCLTLRIIVILMETIKDLYIGAHPTATGPRSLAGDGELALGYRWESGTQSWDSGPIVILPSI
jgi:hypothetical protein